MDDDALHILLLLGFHRSNREIVRRIKKEGLMPGQPKILEYLWFHNGASQKEIGRERQQFIRTFHRIIDNEKTWGD